MSAFQTGLTANKTAINTDWTTKTAPSSISPTDGGGNVEDLNQLIQDLGWDGDLATQISTEYNVFIGVAGLGGNVFIEDDAVTVRQLSTAVAKLNNSAGTGILTLRDGNLSGIGATVSYNGTPFSGSLTANRYRYPLNASGSELVRVANNDLTAQTAAVASLATFTAPTADTTFSVCGYVNITTIGTAVLNMTVNFTDRSSVNRTVVLPAVSVTSAAPIANMAAGDYYGVLEYPVRAKGGTAVTVAVAVVSGSGMTFDCGATITQRT